MPNPLPIGTEYDETYLGLRVRVVGHHKDQFGQVVNDVVKVSELPPGGRRMRTAPRAPRTKSAGSKAKTQTAKTILLPTAAPAVSTNSRQDAPDQARQHRGVGLGHHHRRWHSVVFDVRCVPADSLQVCGATNGPGQTQEITHDDSLRHYPRQHPEAAGIARSPGEDDPQALRRRATARAQQSSTSRWALPAGARTFGTGPKAAGSCFTPNPATCWW